MKALRVGQLRAWKAVKSQTTRRKRGGELFLLLRHSLQARDSKGGSGYWVYHDLETGNFRAWEWESHILAWSDPVDGP